MDYTRYEINRMEFKDIQNGFKTQHLYIEVVMVDQSPENGKSVLYQLNKDRLTPYDTVDFLRQEFISLPHPAFTLLGHIEEIHFSKKSIRLHDGNSVIYKYMILVAGVNQKEEEGTLLQTLKDALMLDAINVKDKILKPTHSYFLSGKHNSKHRAPSHSFCVPKTMPLLQRNMDKIACDKFSDTTYSQPSFGRPSTQKKLCFLQM
jgi:hypothetical protein